MSQISNTTIEAVRDLPIENVIQNYVQLKRAGASYKACCPLHGEKTPSFMVSPVKNIFKCFGCGAGGDAIQFVMLHDALPFYEAIKAIARDHGIEIKEKEGKEKTPDQVKQEESMYAMMEKAQEVYRKAMDEETIKYLYQRNLTHDTIIEWQFGVCRDWKLFTPDVIKLGYSIAEKCGLVKSSANQNVYDYFHHRITVPIHDRRGRVIGFGGRKFYLEPTLSGGTEVSRTAEGPKYINSPDNELYNKSNVLFGLHKAVKNFKKHGMACLVEGYFDVIKMHQRGWDNTVGSCGTALTEKHAKMLKRFTDTVLVLRDGDKAGQAAAEKDIPILAAQQFNIWVCVIPTGEDPDTLFDSTGERIMSVLENYQDGIEFLCDKYLDEGQISASAMAGAIEKVVTLLALITNEIRQEQYIKSIAKRHELRAVELSKPLDKKLKAAQREREEQEDQEDELPHWIDRQKLEEDGFYQLPVATKGYKPGIYFRNSNGTGVYRTTNFTLKPLYHVYEQTNNRRIVELFNCVRNSVVEMPTEAFVNQNTFESELLKRGNFRTEFQFQKIHFKRVIGWLSDSMPLAYELKTLGWQPEGFFAYSDAVWHNGTMQRYDDMGMVKIEDKHYLSLGKSKIHRDERMTDNPYENDLYLSYTNSDITFEQWASLFNKTYAANAPYGIGFAFLTIFKDIVTRVAKMPMLYLYGMKGSGKSEMGESLAWLFFSGKNGEGDLIRGFNLNPGQGTPFSFFNRVERFRNCPILFNEFDENKIEDWKFGTFKAAYDGEGREVGDGDSGKKRKTRIQKIQGTVIIVGQYISIKDDGSVLSRSISCQFSLERVKDLTEEQKATYEQLKAAERHGLNSLLLELLKYREQVKEKLPKVFLSELNRLTDATRAEGERVEARLLNNYSLVLAANKLLGEFITLPFSYDAFFQQCKRQVIAHNKLLKDNSAVNIFWKGVETMFDQGQIVEGLDIKITTRKSIALKADGETTEKTFMGYGADLLLMRFPNVYSKYEKYYRERKGNTPPAEDTLLLYMRDQPYFIGSCPAEWFNDKRTSCYVFDYSKMLNLGIVLQKTDRKDESAEPKKDQVTRPAEQLQMGLQKISEPPF